MSVLLYNLLLGLLGAGTLVTQRRRLPVRGLFGFVMALFGLGLVLGFLFHQDEPLDPMFGAMRMWSYGIFLQLPVVLLIWAWLDRISRPRGARLLAAAAVVVASIGIDAFVVEPTWLEVNEIEIVTSKVKAPMTIAVLADIQSDDIGEYERGAVRAAMAVKPDLILLPGDYIQAKTPKLRDENAARLRDIMREEGLSAPLGAFAVAGNVDNHLVWPTIFTGKGISTATVSRVFHVNPELSITALTLADSFDTELEVAPQPGLHIVVGHAPDFALGNVPADLLVAGHTHGGQVRLPFFGPLVTLSTVPRSWASGLTERPGGGRLVVSKGIGLERGLAPRLRFNCRPEVVILRLRPTP